MPTLDWIGKKAVVNHHQEVPYHLLRDVPNLGCGPTDSDNLIVEGDNLTALKALLPYYAGQVKCIYIDPPYNTGNEGWVYNDAVNSPEINAWLGKVVGKEAEDLSRHDKWLCMMYPRLKLLREFLREDGVIIISIDDFEAYRLRNILDEVFLPQNFIAQLVWDKTRKNDAKLFSIGHEYAIVYAKSLQTLKERKTVWREQKPGARDIVTEWKRLVALHGEEYETIQNALRDWYKKLPTNHPSKKLSRYKWVDKFGPWRDRDISWPGGGGPRYDVIHRDTHLPCVVPEAGWRFSTKEEMNRQIEVGLVEFRKDHTQPPFRKAHLLPTPEEQGVEDDEACIDEEDAGLLVMPSVLQKQAQVSVKLLRKIFEGKQPFPNPKDHEVLMRLIDYVTGPDDIILDSFGGSGTTAHAILALNKRDSTKRRFVMVEMIPEIAQKITSERVRRIIKGISDLEALGGGFRYVQLGEPLFDATGKIRPTVRFRDLARHVFFTETGTPLPHDAPCDKPLLGVAHGTGVYLLYNGILKDKSPDGGNVLTQTILNALPPHDGPKVIYAVSSRVSPHRLKTLGIVFKQTPYAIKVR